jgi:hypothetical protein
MAQAKSPASLRGGPGSPPDQSVWYLWWTKWHWNIFSSEFCGFSLSVSFHRSSPRSYIWGTTIGPIEAEVQRRSLKPST